MRDSEDARPDGEPGATDASKRNSNAADGARRSAAASVAAIARLRILDALYATGSGHFGGACSVVEVLQAILSHADIRPRIDRGDILILSKGHGATAYYALLDALGWASFDLSRYGD